MISKEELGTEALKLSPIVVGKGMTLWGIGLPDLVSMATLAYVVILIVYKLWSWTKELIKEKKNGD